MAERGRQGFYGWAVGVLVGFAFAGGAGAGTNYISSPWVGVPIAAVGGLLGFASGVMWDQRRERLARAERWSRVFAAGPCPVPGVVSGDSVLGLLSPWEALVPYATRRLRHVADIRRWCVEGQQGRVWLLSGEPGSGKTRLAMRVSEALRTQRTESWAVGWVRTGHGRAAMEIASCWPRPVLAIVDDADVRDDLEALLSAVHRPGGAQKVRVLVVAREFTDWWTMVQQSLPFAVEVAAEQTLLGVIADDVAGQRVAAKKAVAVFAERIGVDAAPVQLTGITARSPLISLHAAALEAVLQTAEGRGGPVNVLDAVGRLMGREQHRWLAHSRKQGLDAYPGVTVNTLRDLLAFTMMASVRTSEDAYRLLPLLSGLGEATPDLIDRLVVWLHLYPRVAGFWARPLIPCVLAEHLIADAVAGNVELAAAICLAADTPERAFVVIRLLTRASAHVASAESALTTLLQVDPKRLLPTAVSVAATCNEFIDAAIATTVDNSELDGETVQAIQHRLPMAANVLIRTRVSVGRVVAANTLEDNRRAVALKDFAGSLSFAGRHEEADVAADGAVTVLRRSRAASPDNLPFLADALRTRGHVLTVAGRCSEAVTTAGEAVAILRPLVVTDSDVMEPLLAKALTVFGNALIGVDRLEESVDALTEAVSIWQSRAGTAAADNSSCVSPEEVYLANTLACLANALRIAGRHEEAICAAGSTVAIWRFLADADAAAYEYFLAHALANLADALGLVGRPEEAVAAANEAVSLRRALFEVEPLAYWNPLSKGLIILSRVLRMAGVHNMACAAAAESVSLSRMFTGTEPVAGRRLLGEALTQLTDASGAAARYDETVRFAAEALAVWRELVEIDPAAHRYSLAAAMADFANALVLVGRFKEAFATASEAVALHQQIGRKSSKDQILNRIIRECG